MLKNDLNHTCNLYPPDAIAQVTGNSETKIACGVIRNV